MFLERIMPLFQAYVHFIDFPRVYIYISLSSLSTLYMQLYIYLRCQVTAARKLLMQPFVLHRMLQRMGFEG